MKRFVEKIIRKLEKHIFSAELYNYGWKGQTVHNLLCLGDVKNVAEQLAEEYNNYNDFCEWKTDSWGLFPIKTSCENSLDVNYGYEFCPYCGKKIKVIK